MFSTCESFIAIGLKVCAHGIKTPGTTACIVLNIFNFQNQQLMKVSSQSDEWCVLLVGQNRLLQLVQF